MNNNGTLLSLPWIQSRKDILWRSLSITTALEMSSAQLLPCLTMRQQLQSQRIPFDQQHQFPVVAFQANVVGPDNASNSQFSSSGAGELATIFYSVSSGQLCAEGTLPELWPQKSGNTVGNTLRRQSRPTFSTGPYPSNRPGASVSDSIVDYVIARQSRAHATPIPAFGMYQLRS